MSGRLDYLIIGCLLDEKLVGVLGITRAPLEMFSKALSSFHNTMVMNLSNKNEIDIQGAYKKYALFLIILAAVFFVFVNVFGKTFVQIIFGLPNYSIQHWIYNFIIVATLVTRNFTVTKGFVANNYQYIV